MIKQSWLLIGMRNMATKILVDTNVLLDYLLTREPFYEDAKKVVAACVDGKAKGLSGNSFLSSSTSVSAEFSLTQMLNCSKKLIFPTAP